MTTQTVLPDLSTDQEEAHAAIDDFVRDPHPALPYFVLFGLAGTGKTTLMSRIARERPGALLCAFTGKAASVLRGKTGMDVSTVHGAIYDYRGQAEDEETGKQNPIFASKEADYGGKLVLLDECSTIGRRIAGDLLDTGARVVACGDPGQLPPVRDGQFFSEADFTLTKVHRQALESPIIRQAHSVRQNGIYAPDGEDFRVVTKAQLMADKLIGFGGIALCWRNATRVKLNASRRRSFGLGGDVVEAGEPVMVLRNDHRIGVYNGATYTVACRRKPGDEMQVTEDGGRTVLLHNVTCEGIDRDFEERRNDNDYLPVTLAYAATAHKAQGSEWNDVMVVDEYDRAENRREWMYTALTRAAKRVLVVRG